MRYVKPSVTDEILTVREDLMGHDGTGYREPLLTVQVMENQV